MAVKIKNATAKFNSGLKNEAWKILRRAIIPQVRGLILAMICTARGAFSRGKKAPERKKLGITKKFIISWKPWKSRINEAIKVPMAV